MNATILVSVIVPIYNNEAYLSQCIDSILTQTYANIELILVDDGSLDRSGVICDDYAKQDKRIKVIHKNNAGVSAAMNDGIECSQGDFLTLVDSDDYLDNDFIENAVFSLQNSKADLFLSGVNVEVFKGDELLEVRTYNYAKKGVFSVRELLEQANVTYDMICISGSAYKVFRTSVIRENDIRYMLDISLGEDFCFNLTTLSFARSVCIDSHSYYHYRCGHAETLFTKFHPEIYEAKRRIVNRLMTLVERGNCNQYCEKNMIKICLKEMIGCIHSFFLFHRSKEEKMKVIKEVMNDQLIQKYPFRCLDGWRHNLLFLLLKIKASRLVYGLLTLHYGK